MGTLSDPWGILGDPLGKAWGPSGMSWDLLGTPWRALWDHLEVLLDTLGVSWGFFRGNLELQGASLRFQRVPRRALGGILGALWRLRKGLRSNSLQYAKTFKFTVRYCKIRGPERQKSFQIKCYFVQNPPQTVENRKRNDLLSKITTGAAKMTTGRSAMSSGGGVERVARAWGGLGEGLARA